MSNALKVSSFLFVSMMVIAGCSSDDSGSTGGGYNQGAAGAAGTTGSAGAAGSGGTKQGGGLGGLFGGGGKAGSGTGAAGSGTGTAGSAGSSTGSAGSGTSQGGDVCAPSAGDGACDACLRGSCCAETKACGANSECVATVDCINACPDETCANNCGAAHPQGNAAFAGLVTCLYDKCASACGLNAQGGGGTTGGGGSSGSGGGEYPSQCLPGYPQQDDSYCPADLGKPNMWDCPGGSPDASCVDSPTGASNVFCCP